jgi:GMP synthase (glutamine-hydrolysing)
MEYDAIEARLPAGFEVLGVSPSSPFAAVGDVARRTYGVQFHPEGAPGPQLDEVMDSFTKAVNGARRST